MKLLSLLLVVRIQHHANENPAVLIINFLAIPFPFQV